MTYILKVCHLAIYNKFNQNLLKEKIVELVFLLKRKTQMISLTKKAWHN